MPNDWGNCLLTKKNSFAHSVKTKQTWNEEIQQWIKQVTLMDSDKYDLCRDSWEIQSCYVYKALHWLLNNRMAVTHNGYAMCKKKHQIIQSKILLNPVGIDQSKMKQHKKRKEKKTQNTKYFQSCTFCEHVFSF